jgi:hypothetical protein
MVPERTIGCIHLAAGEHIGATQYVGQAVALDQKNLRTLGAIAQYHNGGCITGRGGGDFGVQFHDVALVAFLDLLALRLAVELALWLRGVHSSYFLQDILCR